MGYPNVGQQYLRGRTLQIFTFGVKMASRLVAQQIVGIVYGKALCQSPLPNFWFKVPYAVRFGVS